MTLHSQRSSSVSVSANDFTDASSSSFSSGWNEQLMAEQEEAFLRQNPVDDGHPLDRDLRNSEKLKELAKSFSSDDDEGKTTRRRRSFKSLWKNSFRRRHASSLDF